MLSNANKYTAFNVMGADASFSTSAAETVWAGTGNYPWLSAAGTLSCVSSDIADTAALEVTYLDAAYTEKVVLITMGGTTPATGPTDFYRLISAKYLVSFGPVGAITLSVGGSTVGVIPIGRTMTDDAIYTIPNKFRFGWLDKVVCFASKGSDAVFQVFARQPGGTFYLIGEFGVFETSTCFDFSVPLRFAPGTDFEVRALSKTGSSSGGVTLMFALDA